MIKVGDIVRVLPNKKVGKVTDISDGFVILDDNQARPYMPQQLELELKRYVLFDTNKIIDTVLDDYIVTNNQLYAYHFGSAEPIVANIKKTSYNILDLVEVENGDAIGYRFYGSDYEHLEKQSSEEYLKSTLSYNKKHYVIIAIYKRQTNGDYKRYEVEA